MARSGFLALLAAFAWTGVALAHHPFAAEFDVNKPIALTGTVTKVEWQSPHVYAYIDAKDDQGKVANWKVELGSPTELTKAGWTRASLETGASVTFDGWRARDGSNFANAESVTIGDRKLVAASSYHTGPVADLARADTSGPQSVGTSGQELPSTSSPLALYLLLGGLSLAGAYGVRTLRR